MNYQDYQKNKERKFPIGAKVTPGDPIKIEKKHTPKIGCSLFGLTVVQAVKQSNVIAAKHHRIT